MYIWRIREARDGAFYAEFGVRHEGGVTAWNGVGCTMAAFVVTESHRFDTRREAVQFINAMRGF